MQNNKNNTRDIKRITLQGLLLNLFLSGVKFLLGIIGRSQAVIADAVHSLSDIATDLMIIFGLKYWSAPPDKNHPYGHQRFETLITTFIGIILGIVALGIGYNALTSLQKQDLQAPLLIAVIGPALSLILKEILFKRTLRIGKKTRSSSLIANAWHHRSDVLSSIPPLLAITVSSLDARWAFLDRIAALFVVLFILKVSVNIIKPVFLEITETGLPENEINRIRSTVLTLKGVEDVHNIRSRRISSNIYIDLHVLVRGDLSVKEGHEISEAVSRKLINDINDIYDVVVHIEPFEF